MRLSPRFELDFDRARERLHQAIDRSIWALWFETGAKFGALRASLDGKSYKRSLGQRMRARK